jgi:DNA-directed RNA polymerase subunit K
MIKEELKQSYTKYEIARILGARALQIAMDAPLLIKIEKEKLEIMKYDPISIAEAEFNSGILPITVKRPLPRRIEGKLKRDAPVEEKKVDVDTAKKEKHEEKEIKEEGEIMEMAQPEDETEVTEESEEGV